MKKYILGIIVIIAVIFVSGCITDSDENTDDFNGTKTLSQNGISITYPGNWVVAEAHSENSIIAVADPNSKDTNDLGSINVNIERKNLSTPLNSFFTQTYKKLFSNSDYQLISQGNTSIGEFTALECLYLTNDNGNIKKHRAIWIENNKEVYVILCTAPQNEFSNQEKIFDFIVSSFRIV